MAGTNTQMGIQNTTAPTSMSQPPVQQLFGDCSHTFGKYSGSAGSNKNPIDPDPDLDPEKKKRDKAIDAKRQGRFLIDSESLKVDYAVT